MNTRHADWLTCGFSGEFLSARMLGYEQGSEGTMADPAWEMLGESKADGFGFAAQTTVSSARWPSRRWCALLSFLKWLIRALYVVDAVPQTQPGIRPSGTFLSGWVSSK